MKVVKSYSVDHDIAEYYTDSGRCLRYTPFTSRSELINDVLRVHMEITEMLSDSPSLREYLLVFEQYKDMVAKNMTILCGLAMKIAYFNR